MLGAFQVDGLALRYPLGQLWNPWGPVIHDGFFVPVLHAGRQDLIVPPRFLLFYFGFHLYFKASSSTCGRAIGSLRCRRLDHAVESKKRKASD